MTVEVNYLAVLLAGISAMIVGGLWYSPLLFGKLWQTTYHQDKAKAKRETPVVMGTVFIFALLQAYVIAHVAYLANQFFDNGFLQDSLTTAFWLWLGINTPGVLGSIFEQRRKLAILLNVANQLVTMLVMAAIIGLLKP